MGKSSRNPSVLAEDPYLALNNQTASALEAMRTVRESVDRGEVDTTALDAFGKSIGKLLDGIASLTVARKDAGPIEVKMPAIEFPKSPTEWEVTITGRDENGRAETFRFKAVK